MLTNFELKRLKPKLDIVKKPENRVHELTDSNVSQTRLPTEGFCSAPLRSRDIRDKVRNGMVAFFRDQLYFAATKQRRTKSFDTHVHNTSNNTSTKLQLQLIKLHIEIVRQFKTRDTYNNGDVLL